jgi:hypothetical protein
LAPELNPSGLPSAEDLDRIAAEEQARENTSYSPVCRVDFSNVECGLVGDVDLGDYGKTYEDCRQKFPHGVLFDHEPYIPCIETSADGVFECLNKTHTLECRGISRLPYGGVLSYPDFPPPDVDAIRACFQEAQGSGDITRWARLLAWLKKSIKWTDRRPR